MPKLGTLFPLALPVLFILLIGASGCPERCDQAKDVLERAKAIVATLELIDEASPQFNLGELQEARAILAQAEVLFGVLCPVPGLALIAAPTGQDVEDYKVLKRKVRLLERSSGL